MVLNGVDIGHEEGLVEVGALKHPIGFHVVADHVSRAVGANTAKNLQLSDLVP